MYCSICQSPARAAVIEAWASNGSLRKTAAEYNVGYRSLQRHLDLCVASIVAEQEQADYEAALHMASFNVRIAFVEMKKIEKRKNLAG